MILGITGGICAGKSTATGVIDRLGVRIIDCDEVSHHLTKCEPSILEAIRAAFGPAVFHEGGALDRAALAALIFDEQPKRRQLENILHPPIKNVAVANVDYARRSGQPLVVVAPLLIEAGLQSLVDHLWVISCTPEHQLERLHRRRNVGRDQAQRWIDAQLPMEQKEKQADTVLRNDGSVEEFEQEVLLQWRALNG